ncbi:MAG: hypothetical protein FWG20_05050 [Candidatus Cloacimonetes bacterium]|nr:hypothetical protein [Candidatus Cloacimonadota bacterium]
MEDLSLTNDSVKILAFNVESLNGKLEKFSERIVSLSRDINNLEHKLITLPMEYDERYVKKSDYEHRVMNCRNDFDERYVTKSDYDVRILNCRNDFDERYVQETDIETIITSTIEKYNERKLDKNQKNADFIKTIMHIAITLAPYIIIVFGWITMHSDGSAGM